MQLIPNVGAGQVLEQRLLATDRAVRIGAVQRLDYQKAVVLTHDLWKFEAGGIPQFSFLIATARDISDPTRTDDDEVLLLRVEGTAPLSLEGDLHAMREEALRNALSRAEDTSPQTVLDLDIDPFTKNRASFTGLACRVLGTFYEEDLDGTRVLQFGSDVDNFYATSAYRVYKPVGEGLSAIASYMRPERAVDRVQIGVVRYSATRRRSLTAGQADAAVELNMNDVVGNKTGLLGMTRSGKSNTAKIIIARTFIASERRRAAGAPPIGQLIFDPQGEYANDNVQDGSAIAAIGEDHVRIYRFGAVPGTHVRPLGINFFDESQISFVQQLIADELRESGVGYINDFAQATFAGSDDHRENARAARGRLILYASLVKAGFTPPSSGVVRFPMKREVREAVEQRLGGTSPFTVGNAGNCTLAFANVTRVVDAVLALKDSNQDVADWTEADAWKYTEPIYSARSSGRDVRGYRGLRPVRRFHDVNTSKHIGEEIYEDLGEGRIVVVDLHLGSEVVIQRLSSLITEYLLERHMDAFTSGHAPQPIQVMLEEAHNLFSSKRYDAATPDIWVRLAKEASKLSIGMIYATQEVSGVAHQVKANTANWFVSHLNNRGELNELSKFYDFASYADAILASEDRGYIRLKTLSSPFIVPTQVERYDVNLVNLARASAGLPKLANEA